MTNEKGQSAQQYLLKLFQKSVLKQAKFKNLKKALTEPLKGDLLDLGSDNGVISYKLRELGGTWHSADLNTEVIESITMMVGERVFLVEGKSLPFQDELFSQVVVVDMLEHLEDDQALIDEICRCSKPGSTLILNTPNQLRLSPLRVFKHLIGQTDESHGHMRPGYSPEMIKKLCISKFSLKKTWTYSGFFSELIDSLIVFAYGLLKGKTTNSDEPSKGLVVTGDSLRSFQKQFKLYSLIYPIIWSVSRLDFFLSFLPSHMRITVLVREE